jgi:hypothetical protein
MVTAAADDAPADGLPDEPAADPEDDDDPQAATVAAAPRARLPSSS